MFSQLGDDEVIRRQLEASLGLDKLESVEEPGEALEPLEPVIEEGSRKRHGVGFKVPKKRVFCAEEVKLKEVLKSKKGKKKGTPKPDAKKVAPEPDAQSGDEEEISRLDMILKAATNKKKEREKLMKRRMGKD